MGTDGLLLALLLVSGKNIDCCNSLSLCIQGIEFAKNFNFYIQKISIVICLKKEIKSTFQLKIKQVEEMGKRMAYLKYIIQIQNSHYYKFLFLKEESFMKHLENSKIPKQKALSNDAFIRLGVLESKFMKTPKQSKQLIDQINKISAWDIQRNKIELFVHRIYTFAFKIGFNVLLGQCLQKFLALIGSFHLPSRISVIYLLTKCLKFIPSTRIFEYLKEAMNLIGNKLEDFGFAGVQCCIEFCKITDSQADFKIILQKCIQYLQDIITKAYLRGSAKSQKDRPIKLTQSSETLHQNINIQFIKIYKDDTKPLYSLIKLYSLGMSRCSDELQSNKCQKKAIELVKIFSQTGHKINSKKVKKIFQMENERARIGNRFQLSSKSSLVNIESPKRVEYIPPIFFRNERIMNKVQDKTTKEVIDNEIDENKQLKCKSIDSKIFNFGSIQQLNLISKSVLRQNNRKSEDNTVNSKNTLKQSTLVKVKSCSQPIEYQENCQNQLQPDQKTEYHEVEIVEMQPSQSPEVKETSSKQNFSLTNEVRQQSLCAKQEKIVRTSDTYKNRENSDINSSQQLMSDIQHKVSQLKGWSSAFDYIITNEQVAGQCDQNLLYCGQKLKMVKLPSINDECLFLSTQSYGDLPAITKKQKLLKTEQLINNEVKKWLNTQIYWLDGEENGDESANNILDEILENNQIQSQYEYDGEQDKEYDIKIISEIQTE